MYPSICCSQQWEVVVHTNDKSSDRSSTNDSIHIGKLLSQTFEKGRAGGHKSLAGGQIPFSDIDCENSEDAMKTITSILKSIFGSEEE